MKTRVILAVVASAAMLFSFSLISGSPKKANQEKVVSNKSYAPVGGMVVEEIQRYCLIFNKIAKISFT